LVDIHRTMTTPFDIVDVTPNGFESIVVLKKWATP
jgi:hypothetical protein